MAESVDALVSNTNVRKDVPVRPRLRVQRGWLLPSFFLYPESGSNPLCLGALPLLYPAAPPSVFAYEIGKYTALAVALGREYVVGFWGLYCLDFFYERWRLNLCGKLIHNFCTLFSNPQLLITTFLLTEKVLYLYGYGN